MSPGLIGHQAYSKSYLSLQPSTALLKWHLIGDHERVGGSYLPRPHPKLLGAEGLMGVRPHPEPENFPWTGEPGQVGSLSAVAQDWVGYDGRGGQERLGSSQASRDVPYSIYPEPGWSSTPQGPGFLHSALPLRFPTCLDCSFPFPINHIGLVK